MNEAETLRQLADILPPPAPAAVNWLPLILGLVVAIIAALAIVIMIKRSRPRPLPQSTSAAQHRLAALRKAWQAQTIDDRTAAYDLATLLRLGLGLPQLTPQHRPAAVMDETQWRDIIKHLDELRYRDQPTQRLSPQCFEHAARWLSAAPAEAR